jgi:hypothetical protein
MNKKPQRMPMNVRKVSKLRRGDVVLAIRSLDPLAADVTAGLVGVVFEEYNFYEDGGGPMVRWLNFCCSNVYDGDVVRLPLKKGALNELAG